jgi:thiamine biosynthesis lipoprotein
MVSAPQELGIRFAAMASECEVRLAVEDETRFSMLARAAIEEVRRIEAKYSRYRDDSIIARINRAAGVEWVGLDAETEALLGYADTLFHGSAGKFDITSGVLRRAWDFRSARVPDASELAPLLDLVGWGHVERSAGRIRLARCGMELDFGGFGKEYAADRAAALLAALDVRHGYVNLGGDLHVIGPQPDGQPWRIGIQDPRNEDALIASIPVQSGALATSGDYERYFEVGGQRYCHILDPDSGHPVRYWRSVSVLAPVTIGAGSFATVAMLKQEDGLRFLEESGLAYLAVDHMGRVHSKAR